MKKKVACKFKKNGINKTNSKGFTLVELLAVISLLSIVSVITIWTFTNVIDNAKKKSYKVTINNIEKYSESYVLENNKDISWFDSDNNSVYSCLTVENLIDMGYFSNDILDSKIDDDRNVLKKDYIYVEKDNKTNNITRQVLLYDETSSLYEWCGERIDASGTILFNVEKEREWTQSKNVTITYKLSTNDVRVGYKHSYEYLVDDSVVEFDEGDFQNLELITETIKIFNNGMINAKIDKKDGSTVTFSSKEIGYIDIDKPSISLGEYTGESIVRGNATIPIVIRDTQSGIDISSISLSDFKVYIGDKLLEEDKLKLIEKSKDQEGTEINYYNAELKIDDVYEYAGKLKIIVEKEQISDNVDRYNDRIELTPNITFSNKYKIKYDANGGTGSMADSECIYNSNCSLSENIFVRDGYTFKGWSEDKNATSATYRDKYEFKPFERKDDITLYAVWVDDVKPTVPVLTSIYNLFESRKYRINNYSGDAGIDGTWMTSGTNPFIEFRNIGNISGVNGAYVRLDSALESDIYVMVYYATTDGEFGVSTGNYEDAILKAGETHLYLPFSKTGEWTKVRFDIGDKSGLSYKIKYLGVSATSGQWNNDYVTIRGESSDSGSGISNWYYSNMEIAPEASLSKVTGDAKTGWKQLNGATDIAYYTATANSRNSNVHRMVCDKSGNCSVSSILIKIDKIAPTKPVLIPIYDLYGSKNYTTSGLSQSNGTWTTTNNDPWFSFSDIGNITGVNGAYVRLTEALNKDLSIQIYYGKNGFSESNLVKKTLPAGKTQLYIPINDTSSSWSQIRFDLGSSETVGISYKIEYLGISAVAGQWNNDSMIIQSESSDSDSGIDKWYYSYMSTAPTVDTSITDDSSTGWVQLGGANSPVYLTRSSGINKTMYRMVCDKAGSGNCNVSNVSLKIDKTLPTCSLKISGSNVVFNTKTDNIGVVSNWLSTSSTATSGTSSLGLSAGTKYGFVKDAAGNVGKCSLKVNKVTINYNVNGGTITPNTTSDSGTTYNWTTESDGTIKRNGSIGFHNVVYSKLEDPANYNNTKYINITKTGYIGKTGAEWKCLSGNCKRETYSQTTEYSSNDYCDASTSDCVVELGVNWEPITYTISYNACGGTGTPNSQFKTHGENLILSSTKPTKTGWTFVGWSKEASCSLATRKNYDSGGTYSTNASDTLYAVWRDNTPPTCVISATKNSTTITAACDDNSGSCSYYGWDSSYTGVNSATKTVDKTGTLTYYVKDAAGNIGSCSASISSTTTKYTCRKSAIQTTTISCSESNYGKETAACSAGGYTYSSDTCSRTVWAKRFFRTCKKEPTGNYGFDQSWEGAVNDCVVTPIFTCNAANVNKSYTNQCDVVSTDYSGSITCSYKECSSGSQSGDYCYLYNRTSCSTNSGWSYSGSSSSCSSGIKLSSSYCFG